MKIRERYDNDKENAADFGFLHLKTNFFKVCCNYIPSYTFSLTLPVYAYGGIMFASWCKICTFVIKNILRKYD